MTRTLALLETINELDRGYRVTVEKRVIGPKLAAGWLTLFAYPKQRALREDRVESYANQMRAGHWNVARIDLAKLPDGAIYLINGQHTLSAIAWSNVTIDGVITTHHCATMEDVGVVYGTFDVGASRTFSEAARATDFFDEIGLRSGWEAIDAKASTWKIHMGFTKIGGKKTPPPHWESQQIALAWKDEIRAYYELVRGSTHRRLLTGRASVMAIALITLRHQPKEAAIFWKQVAEDDGLRVGDPAHTLLKWLRSTPVSGQVGIRYHYFVAMAWNAFFERRQIKVIHAYESTFEKPVRLAGTPYDGR